MFLRRLYNKRLQPIGVLSKSEDTYDDDDDALTTTASAKCDKEAPAAVSETCHKDAPTTADAATNCDETPAAVATTSRKEKHIKLKKGRTEPAWAERMPHCLQLDDSRIPDRPRCRLRSEVIDKVVDQKQAEAKRQEDKFKRLIAALSFNED
jgi:hypothetical protein